MTTKELITLMSDSKNKMLKADQLQVVLKKKLDVKEYISIKDKKKLVDDIVNECILYEDGVFKFDDTDKYICFTMKTIEAYTNIELSDDIEDDYDLLCEARLLNTIIEAFNGEYENVKLLLQMKTDYILSGNTIEAQLGRFLDELLNKVDDITKVLSNRIDKFDISNLPFSMDDFAKLMEFVNSQKK